MLLNFQKDISTIINQLQSQKENWIDEIVTFLKMWSDANDFFISETSGSTGNPKKIKISKLAAINSAKKTIKYFGLNEGSTSLLAMNSKYIGARMMIVRAIVSKSKLFCVQPSADPLKDVPSDFQIDFAPLVAYQVSETLSSNKINQVSKILIGGSSVDEFLLEKISKSKVEFYSSYAMTETISHVALLKLNGKDKSKYYKLMEGVEVSLDQDGRLIINSPDIEVYNLKTNDVATLHSNGEIEILGRFDNVIISGGVKINLEKLEKEITKYINSDFYLSWKKDEKLGQKLVLVTDDKNFTYDLKSLPIEKFHIPKEVVFVDEIKYNENGKLQRKLDL